MKQALCAEPVGTLFQVMTVVGSRIVADQLSDGIDSLALIGNTLATGAMLVVLIAVWGPVSGAQVNPAVTFTYVELQKYPHHLRWVIFSVRFVAALQAPFFSSDV